jgi:hypothetical protein
MGAYFSSETSTPGDQTHVQKVLPQSTLPANCCNNAGFPDVKAGQGNYSVVSLLQIPPLKKIRAVLRENMPFLREELYSQCFIF